MTDETADRLAIRDLIEEWVITSDSGDWEGFRAVWHDDGRMYATWTQGTAEEFVEARRRAFDADFSILHFLGGTSVKLSGARAVAQTKMTINQRGDLHGVLCDVVCTGRFYDFLEKRDGRWGMVLRQPIYEKDRLDPVDPAASIRLDADLLKRFPEGYRHLAYFQSENGYDPKTDMPGLKGAEVEALYARGKAWLAGESID